MNFEHLRNESKEQRKALCRQTGMKKANIKTVIAMIILGSLASRMPANEQRIPNPQIDYPGFLQDAKKVSALREQRRVSEERFIRMASEPGTIVFDARSDEKYRWLHVKGAKHLSLPDITAAELRKVIPSKGTRVLIYCNNNFENEAKAFPSKVARASLNIYTFNTLHSYGYTNVYELGPFINIKKAKLEFEGTEAAKKDR
jgi:rhodanese-like protein